MVKDKGANAQRKTRAGYEEDALYREVWEEVHAQKIYGFVRRHARMLIAAGALFVVAVAGVVVIRHISRSNAIETAHKFESAMDMNPALAREALTRLAKTTSGGMGDLALFRAYQLALANGDKIDAEAKLEKLAADGSTRDFKDLALVELAQMKADGMSADEFQKMIAPLLTKRSPFYFTGLLMAAEKYLAEGKSAEARPFIKKITADESAPASIAAVAETLLK